MNSGGNEEKVSREREREIGGGGIFWYVCSWRVKNCSTEQSYRDREIEGGGEEGALQCSAGGSTIQIHSPGRLWRAERLTLTLI